jgi:putative Mg2+ transporter-C (MgtC) family protein
VDAINRQPLDVPSVEATNILYVIARREHQKDVLAMLEGELERSNYPSRELTVHAFGRDEVEIEATLAATSVDGDELDALVERLVASPMVSQAFWSASTTE